MNPEIAEIFPLLAKKLHKQSDLLDYKWLFHEIDPVEDIHGYICDERIFKLADKDFKEAIASSNVELYSPENFPLPFEKFFYVLKMNSSMTVELPLRYTVFQFQRQDGVLSCNQFVIDKKPVGFSCKPTVSVDCMYFEPATWEFFFGVQPSPGSSVTIETLQSFIKANPEDVPLSEHLARLTHYILTCSTYGMFGPVSDTLHYYSTTNPDPVRNAQKIARGNRPKFEWVSSVIEPRTTAPALVLHKGGTHASPKPHERRAHFRRLKSGKSVLVRSTVINKDKMGDKGFVFHDYELTT